MGLVLGQHDVSCDSHFRSPVALETCRIRYLPSEGTEYHYDIDHSTQIAFTSMVDSFDCLRV